MARNRRFAVFYISDDWFLEIIVKLLCIFCFFPYKLIMISLDILLVDSMLMSHLILPEERLQI